MKNLVIVLLAVFMMSGVVKAETWTEYPSIFDDFYTSGEKTKTVNVGGVEQLCSPNEILIIDSVEYICPDTGIVIVGGTNYECTRELYYGRMWNGETVKGKFDNCLSDTSVAGGDTYNTTNNTTNETTTNNTIKNTTTCNGCPTIHKFKPVQKYKFR